MSLTNSLKSDVVPYILTFENRQTSEPRTPYVQRVPYSPATRAGVPMNADRAMQISTVWRCIAYLSQSIAKLPWRVRRGDDVNSVILPRHPVDWLINSRASDEWSAFQFRETLMSWALRHGNGYAEIERTIDGRPYALHPIEPQRVVVMRDTDTGELYYLVSGNGDNPPVILDMMDMFHVRGYGESPVGVNFIHYAAESLGWAKAVQTFGANFFGNGAQLAGVVTMKKPLSMEALNIIRKDFNKLYGGSRTNSVAFLDNEMQYQSVGTEPEKGQFIETNEFLVDEICRWFGIPPHKVYELRRSTFSNIEHMSLEVVEDSLKPWAQRFIDEANFKLFGQNRGNLYTWMDFKKIIQIDTKTRLEYATGLRNIGVLNANEIRDEHDYNAIPVELGGDKYVMQSGMTTLEHIGETPEPAPVPEPAVSDPVETDPPTEEQVSTEDVKNLAAIYKVLNGSPLQ